MTNYIIILILILIVVIVTYTLLCERSDSYHEGLEVKATEDTVIKDSNDVIKKEPLKNLCILASSDSIRLNGNASLDNIDKLLKKGVRWLDFNVFDNNGVPHVSEDYEKFARLDTILKQCKLGKNTSENTNMPLFINIRVSSGGSEDFYKNIYGFFNEVFTEDELYNMPGKVETLLSDTKDKVMNVVDKFGKTIKTTIRSLPLESFENTKDVLGTENELYENLTPLETAYLSNKTIEGLQNNDDIDIEERVINQREKVDKIKKSLADVEKQIIEFQGRVRKFAMKMSKKLKKKLMKNFKILHQEVKNLRQSLMREEKKLIEFKRQQTEIDKNDADIIERGGEKFGKEAMNRYNEINTDEPEESEDLNGLPESVRKKIVEARKTATMNNYDNVLTKIDLGKSQEANELKNRGITSIGKNFKRMELGVQKELTQTSQCNRCITCDTRLDELGNKVIFVLTRSNYENDSSYNKSKLSMSGKDGVVNIVINDYNNNVPDNKFYNVIYSKDNHGTTLPNDLMKITTVSSDTTNTKNMILNNIKKNQIQVLQVPNLENKTEYVGMFNHYKSAFIPMIGALKYIDEQNW